MVVRKVLTEKMTFKQRLEGSKRVSDTDISGKNIQVRRKNQTVENVPDMCEEQHTVSVAGAK